MKWKCQSRRSLFVSGRRIHPESTNLSVRNCASLLFFIGECCSSSIQFLCSAILLLHADISFKDFTSRQGDKWSRNGVFLSAVYCNKTAAGQGLGFDKGCAFFVDCDSGASRVVFKLPCGAFSCSFCRLEKQVPLCVATHPRLSCKPLKAPLLNMPCKSQLPDLFFCNANDDTGPQL